MDDLIWEILEGDPTREISKEDAKVGETMKGGSPRALKDDCLICLILDCCRFFIVVFSLLLCSRNAFRDGSRHLQKQKLFVKNQKGFNLKMDIKNLNFNDQILVINSSLLGNTAKDDNSFTQMLLRWIA